jgi:hypothetical protein
MGGFQCNAHGVDIPQHRVQSLTNFGAQLCAVEMMEYVTTSTTFRCKAQFLAY